jgi:probable rRNA maturation factor
VSASCGNNRRRNVTIRNRQRARAVNVRQLKRIATAVLADHLGVTEFRLNICLVGGREIARLNEVYLRHQGSTDVLAFDYRDSARPGALFGEIFVCVDEASVQARRFRTTWQAELVRYIVHGLLHLCGYDDRRTRRREKMKRVENRLLKLVSSQLSLRTVAARPANSP